MSGATKRFLALPMERKRKAAHPEEANPHPGWSCVGQEKLSVIRRDKAVLDLKVGEILPFERLVAQLDWTHLLTNRPASRRRQQEFFDIGPEDDELYPNIWTDEATSQASAHSCRTSTNAATPSISTYWSRLRDPCTSQTQSQPSPPSAPETAASCA
ncbi:hypothetical protein BDW66DRAFT_155089 [Aspergillus desertorum]